MKKNLFITMTLIIGLLLSGCGEFCSDIDVPDTLIEHVSYTNPHDKEDVYDGIIYDGRTFIPYGPQDGKLSEKIVKKCIGHDEDDTNSRYYTLNDSDDYVMSYYFNGEMETANFYRAIDTVGNTIETPEYIYNNDYDIWK